MCEVETDRSNAELQFDNMISIGNSSMYSVIAFITLIVAFANVKGLNLQTKLVNVVFRHGDRTPDNNGYELYPNDPYLNDDFYPFGLGELTNNGKMREYQLGQFLRKQYDKFLGKVYIPDVLEAHSTDYRRTKASLQLVLAGLYPPALIQRWNAILKWQPIPTEYIPRLYDNVLLSDECPRYLNEYNQVLELPEVKEELAAFDDMNAKLTELTGKNISTPLDMYYLYHTFVAESFMNLDLPDWAYSLFPYGRLYNGTIFAYKVANYNKLQKRIYGGAVLRKIIDSMKAHVNGTLKAGKKLILYSGHETNIASLLNTLEVYRPHVPEYSSAVIIELLYEGDKYYVKVLYYAGIPSQAKEIKLPDCEVLCPLEKFLQLTADVIPTDEDMICDKTKTESYADQKPNQNMNRNLYNVINNYITDGV
ncbi:hypothetical protein KPH14_004108 [Odynerus spinipes]|uniref:acid phosphatase n=1 Tax=Odynerus spinipes TaxID=1348599 RepID=A0AAD9RYV5_9HYME|nr:hypothetical protein KPH14_004108 [Odynerus spinipes]